MDLKELWNKPESEKEPSPARAELAAMLSGQSRGILGKLRRKLLYKILWGGAIGIAALVFLLVDPSNPGVLLIMGLMLMMVLVLGIALTRYYLNLPKRMDMDREILPVMREYDQLVRAALRFEERVGSFFIIPSPAMGAMAALLESGKDLGERMTDWRWLLLLLGVTAAFAPLGIWMTKWMNRYTFGKYLDQLSANIQAMEEIEAEK